jgi:ELWxxDGT repeat protein
VVPPARLRDIATGGASSVPLTSNKAVAIRSQLHAILDDGSSGLRIWRTDGTSAGTTMLGLPITPPPTGPGSDQMARYGERLVVVTPNGISITDGTPSGTQTLLSDNRPDQSKVKVMGDTIWFTRRDHLYQSNGTVAGTTQVPFVNPIPVREWEVLPNRIVFTNQNAVFSSDSIQPATLLVTGAGFPKLHRLREDLVIIQDVTGLRATDGSLAGTVELALGGISSQPLVLMGQQAFALTSQGVLATDGTPAGTRLIANLPPTMFVRKLVATRSQLYAVASTPATGTELWRVDGSTGQLVLVHDLVTGPESGVMDAAPMGDGELLFLSGGSPATGVEPFVTDGTATGLRLLADINPGQENSNPTLLGLASDKVYLIANDGVHGAELWVLPLSATGAAAVQPYGFGCHGSAGLPQLATTSPPSPGNTLGFQLDRVRGLALAILALGLQDGNMPLSGCDLLVNQPLGSQLGNANVNGAAQFALTLPATPAVLGLSLATQGLALDGLHPRGFAASQGLRLTVGY